MTKTLAALLKFGNRPIVRTWRKTKLFGQVPESFRSSHDRHHLLGIVLPVSSQVYYTPGFYFFPKFFYKPWLYQAPFIMFLFMPGIGKVNLYPVQAIIGDTPGQHFHRVITVNADVSDILQRHLL